MFCKHCKREISDSAKFCPICGDNIYMPISEVSKQGNSEKNLKGLSGWLLLMIVGLFVGILFETYFIYKNIIMFSDGTVQFFSNPISEIYIPNYKSILKFELVVTIILLTARTYLIYLFFKKNKRFPKYYIWFFVTSVIFAILDYALFTPISVTPEAQQLIDEILSKQGREIGKAIIVSLIWTTYIVKSKRVKLTFVED